MIKEMRDYKRFTEKRNGKNVIPLLNSVCGVDLPKWTIAKESDNRRYLSGDAVDKFAEIENKIEDGTLIELPCINKAFGKYCVVFMNKYNGEEFIDRFSFNTLTQAEKKLEELRGEMKNDEQRGTKSIKRKNLNVSSKA